MIDNNANTWSSPDSIYQDFIISRDLIYNPCGFKYSKPIIQKESSEYGGCRFTVNDINTIFRVGKITPTKTGQFVTLWKRINQGPILPYDMADNIGLVIISTHKDNNLGQFIFPKSVLYKYGVISNNNQGGKRAIRIYPPWDITTSAQARKTQNWQLPYFLEIPRNSMIDYARAKVLYEQNGL
jgi:hypothetical protein